MGQASLCQNQGMSDVGGNELSSTNPTIYLRVSPTDRGATVEVASAQRRFTLPDGRIVLAVAGPHPVDMRQVADWLVRGCPDPAPVRQGFAACLVDPRTGALTMAAGARNEITLLWSALPDGGLVVSSRLLDVVDPLPDPQLDLGKLAGILSFVDESDTTVYRGVLRLPVGHTATWRPGTEMRVRRWFVPHEVEPYDRSRFGDEGLRLREVISEAVVESLPTTGGVAAHLSGGLDSTTVVATAAGILEPQGRVVHTLSHLLPEGQWPDWLPESIDDRPHVRALGAGVPGLDQHEFVHDARSPLDDMTWMIERSGTPFLNPTNTPWIRAMDAWAAEHDCAVMLTGAHGSIGYSTTRYGQYRRALRSGRLDVVARDIRSRRAAGDGVMLIGNNVVGEVSPGFLAAWSRARHGQRPDEFSSRDQVVRPELLPEEAARRQGRGGRARHLQREFWERAVISDPSSSTALQPPGLMTWHSDPLSDQEVSRLLFSLPPDAWLGHGFDRAMARRAMSGLVPDSVRLRAGRGIQGIDLGPAISAHQRQYIELLERIEASPLASTLLDTRVLRASMMGGVPTEGRESMLWQLVEGRALGMGQFVVWFEDRMAARGRPAA